jgi:hypothetical protein
MSASLDELADQADTFSKSFESSMQSATDPFAHFGDQADVTGADFEKFLEDSTYQSIKWAAKVQDAIHRGVSVGLVNEMAQAGPKSEPALDALLQLVDDKGVEFVNSFAKAGQDAVDATEGAFKQMVVTAAIETAREAAIVRATTAYMNTGSTEELEKLVANTDKQLGTMAYIAILQLGGIKRAVDDLPTEKDFTYRIHVDEVLGFGGDGVPHGLGPGVLAPKTTGNADLDRYLANLPKNASGGPIRGTSWVGEEGTELFSGRGVITSNDDLMKMLGTMTSIKKMQSDIARVPSLAGVGASAYSDPQVTRLLSEIRGELREADFGTQIAVDARGYGSDEIGTATVRRLRADRYRRRGR